MGWLERNRSFTHVQERIKKIPIEAKLKADNLQISNEKIKGKSVVTGLKDDGVKISTVKFQGKYFVMLGERKWRPKTRAKNKLRLNMKRILNPKLRKEKITMIEDHSYQEYMEEEENLSSRQVHTEKEHSVILESSSGNDKVSE